MDDDEPTGGGSEKRKRKTICNISIVCERKKNYLRPAVGGWMMVTDGATTQPDASCYAPCVLPYVYIPPALLPFEWPHSRGTISPLPLRGTTISRRVRLPAGRIPEKYYAMIAAGSRREGFCFLYTNTMVKKKKPHRLFCFSPINNNSFVHPSHTHARTFVQCWHRANKKNIVFLFRVHTSACARYTRYLVL